MQKNPWKTLSKKEVYSNPWISVSHREVLNPGGGEGIYGVVEFQNIAVGIVPIDEERNTWLVGQYRYTIDQYSWEIPEGGCPLGTDPLASAKRELKEETGLVAQSWQPLLEMHTSNSVTDEYGIVYIAKEVHQELAEPEETEELLIKKLPFNSVYKMVMEGKITDSLSIAAILKTQLWIQSGKI